ncbi:MAG: alpha-2-macroglobulin family protein [Bacteroidota bacterium]
MRFALAFLGLITTTLLMAQTYSADWQRVDEAQSRGRYQTAIEQLAPIFERARRDGKIDQLAKAHFYRAAAIKNLSEDGTEAAIQQLERDLEASRNPAIQALLHLQLAKGYKGYMQEQLFGNSGQTALLEDDEPVEEATATNQPLAEWSTERIARQYIHHALTAIETAQNNRLPLEQIEAIVDEGYNREAEMPTLFDLIVFDVLNELDEGLSVLPEPVEAFRPAEVQLFLPAYLFLNYNPATPDTNSTAYRRLRIYQGLLEVRLEEASISDYHRPALVLADLSRLRWAHQLTGEDEMYKEALDDLLNLHLDTPAGAEIAYELASLQANNQSFWGDTEEEQRLRLVRDRARYVAIMSDYPGSRAADLANEQVVDIDAKRLLLTAEEVYMPDESVLVKLDYRNVEEVFYRLVRLDYTLDKGPDIYDPREINDRYVALKPIQSGSYKLTPNDDYREHETEMALDDLAVGKYVLLMSEDANFNRSGDRRMTSVKFAISQMALMEMASTPAEKRYQIVDRNTGSPLSGVQVNRFERNNQRNRTIYNPLQPIQVGSDGRFSLPTTNGSIIAQFVLGKDTLQHNLRAYGYNNSRRDTRRAHFFLDRAIYRPGQQMFAKVLIVNTDAEGMPSLVTNEEITLKLYDANGEELAAETGRTDQYGAMRMNFTLPKGRLSGSWRLAIDGMGSRGFRVEEYKRPRFEVKLPQPKKPAVLGDSVTLEGQALAYSGPPLADARVSYRVERRVNWWSYRYYGGGPGSTQAILAQGETTTNADGKFEIDFLAEAIQQNDNRYRPYYSFTVYVDVADQTGETHAAQANIPVQQPYAQLKISINNDLDVADKAKLRLDLPPGNTESWDLSVQVEPVEHPDPGLRERRWSVPDRPILSREDFKARFPDMAYQSSGPVEEWTSAGGTIFRDRMQIRADSILELPVENWDAGHYRITVSYVDAEGEEQKLYQRISLSDMDASELPEGVFGKIQIPKRTYSVGEDIMLRLVHQPASVAGVAGWTSRSQALQLNRQLLSNGNNYKYTVNEDDRGGLVFFLQYVYRNRHYSYEERFDIPWKDRQLAIEYETFRDRLRPGEPETWTLKVNNSEGEGTEAQVLASMYDASLDALVGHSWSFGGLYPRFRAQLLNSRHGFGPRRGIDYYAVGGTVNGKTYSLPRFDFGPLQWQYNRYYRGDFVAYSADVQNHDLRLSRALPPPPPPPPAAERSEDVEFSIQVFNQGAVSEEPVEIVDYIPSGFEFELDKNEAGRSVPSIRTNLQETAFFQPELYTDEQGRVSISFTSPEALTSWKFQVLTHTTDLAYALSSKSLKTQKELMVQPNAPRFLREGDRMLFTAKVSNLSEKALSGQAELELFDLETEENLAAIYDLANVPASFTVEPNGSEVVQWEIAVPAGAADRGEIGYRVIARAGEFSDGEQDRLPILTNRVFLTSTESFFLRGKERKTVTLDALANANSSSLTHMGYSLEVTSNPAWLAVKSLPYLVEYPYNCSEQLVNRYFANQISHHLVRTKPTWKTVFEQWKGDSTALLSELERNQDLKQALLEETPWLREAEDEREQRRRLGLLFDLEAVAARQSETWQQLAARQDQSGGFSWMPGGRVSPYITAYVLESLARLQTMRVLNPDETKQVFDVVGPALAFLDNYRLDVFNRWLKGRELTDSLAATYVPSSVEVHYFYLRSYYNKDQIKLTSVEEINIRLRKYNLARNLRPYWKFLIDRLDDTWPDRNLYEQALVASGFAMEDMTERAGEVITSLRERALRKDELGMHWKYGRGYRWYDLPIETHTRLMEAFLINGATQEELDEMRLWLLQNKRTNRWASTKATAAAIYALLQDADGGDEAISLALEGAPVGVDIPKADRSLWSTELAYAQNRAEAGTGYYRMSLPAESVSPDLAEVQLDNQGKSVSWGAIYWQYTEDIDKVQADADGPLALQRKIFRRVNTDQGERLEPITDATELRTGDRLRIQLVVTADRELDFVHLKDRRAAGLEPTEQLSGYRYRSGLGFYFNPTDLAVNFFFDQLPRGTHTLEYDLFVTQKGDFSNGLSQVQCMYAPEFGAYSEGERLVVD